MTLDKDTKTVQWGEKKQSFRQMVLGKLNLLVEKNE